MAGAGDEAEKLARQEVAEQIRGAREVLRMRLRELQAEANEATAEVRRLRQIYASETSISDAVKAGMAERGESPALVLIEKAASSELRTRAAVRVVKRKIAGLDLTPDEFERRVTERLRAGRAVIPKGAVKAQRGERRRRMRDVVTVERMDPAFLFYLSLRYDNLFEPTRSPLAYRCKGCGAEVKTWGRQVHWDAHKEAEGAVVSSGPAKRGGGKPREQQASVDSKTVNWIVKQIEAGVGTQSIVKELASGDWPEHPSGKPWNQYRVKLAYLDAKGMSRNDWKKVRSQIPLAGRASSKKSSTAKAGSKARSKSKTKTAAAGSSKKTTSARKVTSSSSEKTASKPPASADLAAEPAKPHPKPVKAEKTGRGGRARRK